MNTTLGTDTEYFVKKENQAYWHGFTLTNGTKEKPEPIRNIGNLQRDNVLIEFATNPTNSLVVWKQQIKELQHEIHTRANEQKLIITKESSKVYALNSLRRWGDEALQLGCDPDICAYTEEPNPRPSLHTTLRTASGHIHFAAPKSKTREVIILLDYILGIWSLLEDPDDTRRQLYGKAGAYRPKPYGGEYRVLSNFWTLNDDFITNVFEKTQVAVKYTKPLLNELQQIASPDDIRFIIDNYWKKTAEEIYPHINNIVKNGYLYR